MARINVTETYLPPLKVFQVYLESIWASKQLTNQGPLLQEFEQKVEDYLRVKNFHLVSNGTIALQIALKAFDITEGEVITTPFTYVATTSAILWERCEPVFVDIEPNTFCIDASKIEAAITPNTKAIMAVHVFGFPCNIEKIEAIARKHKLKVIYDGAHAFGVTYKGKSLLSYGDVSVCSFHATKLFHTIEGGALIFKHQKISDKLELIKRFGHNGDDHYTLGTNAKASEFQAAMGLANLPIIEENIEKRKRIAATYTRLLTNKFQIPSLSKNVRHNYIYYPVVMKSEAQVRKKIQALNEQDIFPRRYFYPSLNKLPYLKSSQTCPISEDISKRILCLPLYPNLADKDVVRICEILNA